MHRPEHHRLAIDQKQFWSLTMYDSRTWGFVNNPLDRAGLGSFNMNQMRSMRTAASICTSDRTRPAGLESNWIPTMGKEPTSGSGFMPGGGVLDQGVQMPDVELVN